MKRSRPLGMETLEGKVLLSVAAMPPSPSVAADAATPTTTGGSTEGLVATLSTDRPVYRRGRPVTITLTETNISSHDVSFAAGPSLDGVTVSRNGRRLWSTNAGIQPMFVALRTLGPGESYTRTFTWNGHTAGGSAAGRLVVGSRIDGARPVTILIRPR